MGKKSLVRLVLVVILTALLLGLVTSAIVQAGNPDPPGLQPPKKNSQFSVWNCFPGPLTGWWLKDCREWGWEWWDRYYKWNDTKYVVPEYMIKGIK